MSETQFLVLLSIVCVFCYMNAFSVPIRQFRVRSSKLQSSNLEFRQEAYKLRLQSTLYSKLPMAVNDAPEKLTTVQDYNNHKVKPQDLIARYGIAYFLTSISFAIVSYTLCYALISNGVDVESVLKQIGIQSTSTASSAGTMAIAYAMHKAASPIRFPPTVFMTPVVANWTGRRKRK